MLSEPANASEPPVSAFPEEWIQMTQIWASILCFVGSTGNFLTLFVFIFQILLARTKRGRRQFGGGSTYSRNQRLTVENSLWQPTIRLSSYVLLLVHLSFCDFLYCTINLPLTTLTYSYAFDPDYKINKRFCTGAALMRYIIASVEWMTLGMLAIKRCIDINRAPEAQILRTKTAGCLLVTMWVASISFHSIPAFKGHFGYNNGTYKCVMTDYTFELIFFTAEFLAPCILMIFGCISLVYQIWRNVKELRLSGATEDMVRDRFRRLIKSTTLVLCLMFLFLMSVTPVCVYSIHMLTTGHVNFRVGIVLFMVYWVQYAVNFIVYAASNELYRRACRQTYLLIRNEFLKGFRGWRGCRTRGQANKDEEFVVSTITNFRVHHATSNILTISSTSPQNLSDSGRFGSTLNCDNTFATYCCGASSSCLISSKTIEITKL